MLEKFKSYLVDKGGITEAEFQELAPVLQTKTIDKGTYLLREGEVCKYAFFVEQGLLRSFSIDQAGKEHIIQFAPENWIMSDISSNFFNESSDFFIEAIENTEVVLLDKTFFNLSDKSSSFRKYNELLLQNHIRHLQKRVNLLLSASAEKRYLNFIQLYPDLTLRVSQWMIASYLGITPESLSRVRKELATKNFKPN
jgi:CRP-like cAMP-binding protein